MSHFDLEEGSPLEFKKKRKPVIDKRRSRSSFSISKFSNTSFIISTVIWLAAAAIIIFMVTYLVWGVYFGGNH